MAMLELRGKSSLHVLILQKIICLQAAPCLSDDQAQLFRSYQRA